MKRFLTVLLLLGAVLLLAGCGSAFEKEYVSVTDYVPPAQEQTSQPTQPAGQISESPDERESEISPTAIAEPSETDPATTEPITTAPAETRPPCPFDSADADVDLTGSATVAFAALYAMMAEPESYMGKTVCLHGTFSTYVDPLSGNRFYGCVITDVTACCTQGIEFDPAADVTFPEDFPQNKEEITVFGTFDTYEKNGYTFCTLRDAMVY